MCGYIPHIHIAEAACGQREAEGTVFQRPHVGQGSANFGGVVGVLHVDIEGGAGGRTEKIFAFHHQFNRAHVIVRWPPAQCSGYGIELQPCR